MCFVKKSRLTCDSDNDIKTALRTTKVDNRLTTRRQAFVKT